MYLDNMTSFFCCNLPVICSGTSRKIQATRSNCRAFHEKLLAHLKISPFCLIIGRLGRIKRQACKLCNFLNVLLLLYKSRSLTARDCIKDLKNLDN